jgi:hypothetical protein
MILDVYLITLVFAFILFLFAIEKESIIYAMLSFLLWIIIFGASFYIQVPGDDHYIEYTLNAISLAFIFTNLIWALILHFDWRKKLP